jgi:putative ABC transport system permease protein
VLRGRDLAATDRAGTEPVMLVGDYMARVYWPGEQALGKCVILPRRDAACRRVVGVVSDVHAMKIVEAPSLTYYVPIDQIGGWHGNARVLLVRASHGKAPGLLAPIRQASNAVFGGFPVEVRLFSEILAPELRPFDLSATLFSALAVLALVVAAVGVYGTISYATAQRTYEIGVRRALGAQHTDIAYLVLGEGMRFVALGLAAGTVLALVLARVVAALLYNVSPRDPAVMVGAECVLLVIACAACLVPARRAVSVDPTIALRAE